MVCGVRVDSSSLACSSLLSPQSREREGVAERPAFVCQRKLSLTMVAVMVRLDLGAG